MTGFYDAGVLGQVAINLFQGCGYNFYRETNQLRADDQKVRTLVCELLGRTRKSVVEAEGAFRRERIPPPSRANPFPPAEIVADARALEALGHAIGGIEGQVRHAPVPENDRMTQRFRQEASTLAALIEADKQLVGHAETLRAQVAGGSPDAILAKSAELTDRIAAIAGLLAERRLMTI